MQKLPFLVLLIALPGLAQQRAITLTEAVRAALANNYGLKASFQDVQIARGTYTENFFLPSPVIGAEYKEIPDRYLFTKSAEKSYYIEQEIEFPVRYFYKQRALKAGIASAELNFIRDELDLKARTRNAYLNWLGALNFASLAKENLQLSQEFASSSSKLHKAGEIGSIPLSQSRIAVSQARLQVNSTINEEMKARAELLTLMGMDGNVELKARDSALLFTDVNLFLPDDSLITPDFRYADALIREAKADLAYQRSAFLPDLKVEYLKQTIDGKSGFYGIGAGITIPIWFFTQKGAVQKSRAMYLQAQASYNQVVLSIANQWKAIQASASQYRANIREYKEMAEESSKLIRNARKAYNAGELSYLELLAVQQSYIEVQQIYLSNLLNYQLALTDYYRLTGEL